MGAGHDHSHAAGNECTLRIALALTSTFLLTESINGILTKDLALISDAAHAFADVTALAIAFAAVQIGE